MRKKIIRFLVICLLINSCGNKESNLIMLSINGFPDTVRMEGQKINIEDDQISGIYIFDTILIGRLYPTLPYVYRAYNINTYEKLGDFLSKGRGPGEFIQPSILFQPREKETADIKIWIKDFPVKIALLNLTRTLKRGEPVMDKIYDFIRPGKNNILYESNSVYVLEDGIFLMKKDPERSSYADKTYKDPFYVLYDYKNDRCLDTIRFRYDLTTRLWMNDKRNCIVTTLSTADGIDILDINTKKEIILFHKPKLPDELYTFFNMHNEIPDFVYQNCIIVKDMIFALFVPSGMRTQERAGRSVRIHIMSLQGKPLYNLVIDEELTSFSMDERNNKLLGIDRQGQFYRYDLQKILFN